MRLTTRSEYALLALVHLARAPSGKAVPIEEIARIQSIPPGFLAQILLTLKRARYLRSTRGQRGGYRLARRPSEINLAGIIRLLDGALAPTEAVSKYFYEPTPIEKERKLLRVFREIRNYTSDKLEATTLADVK